MARRFQRTRGDRLRVSLETAELEILRSLPEQLAAVLSGPQDDPVLQRLFPTAYLDPTEEAAETEWAALTHPDLLHQRLEAGDLMVATLDRAVTARRGARQEVELEPAEVECWLGVVNDARLALGVRLEVTEGDHEVDPADPSAPAFAMYDWLTWFQSGLLDALG